MGARSLLGIGLLAGDPAVAPPRLRVAGLRNAHGGPHDFALAAGSCLAITGPSGSGKSVLIRMIADLDPHEGDAFLDGMACTAMPAPRWRRLVRYCPAESAWWHERVGTHFDGAPPDVTRLGLRSSVLDQPVASCSTGERQRLALLRSLAGDPPVLLLDEPTGPLDADSTALVEALLTERLQVGAAIVLVTHDEGQADRLGTSRARLQAGRLL